MAVTAQDDQLLDPGDAEADAMWSYSPPAPPEPDQEPYVQSAIEYLAGDQDGAARGTAIGFVDGQRSGLVRLSANGSRSDVHLVAEVSNGPHAGVRRLEATVRLTWLRRVTKGATGNADEAARIVSALEELAALPRQSTVRVRGL